MNQTFLLLKTKILELNKDDEDDKLSNGITKQLFNVANQKTELCNSIKEFDYDPKFDFYRKNNDYIISGPDANSRIVCTHRNTKEETIFIICKNEYCSKAHRKEDIRPPFCITKIIKGSCNIQHCLSNHNIPVNIYEDFLVCPKMKYKVDNISDITFKFYIDSIGITLNGRNIDIGSELLKETNTNTIITNKLLIMKIYYILTTNIEELDNLIVKSDFNLKTIFGNILYRLFLKEYDYVIQKSEYNFKNIIEKLTGMWLEDDISSIINMIYDSLKNPENIKKIINEALDFLNNSIGNIAYNLFLKEYDVIIHKSKYKYKDIIGKITGMYLQDDINSIINMLDDSPENIKKLINEALDVLNEALDEPNEDELY